MVSHQEIKNMDSVMTIPDYKSPVISCWSAFKSPTEGTVEFITDFLTSKNINFTIGKHWIRVHNDEYHGLYQIYKSPDSDQYITMACRKGMCPVQWCTLFNDLKAYAIDNKFPFETTSCRANIYKSSMPMSINVKHKM